MQTVEEAAKELSTATDSLVDGIGRLTDADAREPSLLPGWTRGHVLTHRAQRLAALVRPRDADGRRQQHE
jgi:maleylpyruvate isomerase